MKKSLLFTLIFIFIPLLPLFSQHGAGREGSYSAAFIPGDDDPSFPKDYMNPYLQNMTGTSVYISWHHPSTTNTTVYYGTGSWRDNKASGSYENIAGNIWHTVHLTGLKPGTKYYYRCTTGSDTSAVSTFRTKEAPGTAGTHVRFVLVGDSRTDSVTTHKISTTIEQQLTEDYGDNWNDSVDFLINVGDIVTNGKEISQYKPEYFLPYSNLTNKIPFYVSIGNHENESEYYYAYMKYEDLTGPPYDDPSSQYNEKFYTYRYGRCRFIALNSNGKYQGDVQTKWLKGVLDDAEADDDIDFVFVYCHHPGHTEIWPSGNNFYIQLQIIPLLMQYSKPSMFMYGHSHDYEHGIIGLDESNSNYHQDMHIVLSGGGGAALDRWGMYANQRNYPEIFMTLDHYNYSIIDVNVDDKSYTARTYSLGHPDKPLDNVLVDTWYSKPDQPAPGKPQAFDPVLENDTLILAGSAFSGDDSLFSSQIQVTATPGDYSSPVINRQRDIMNVYGDSGAPDYTPVDRNEGVDITRLEIPPFTLENGSYAWRVRYRDHNLKWSDWSDENTFTFTGIHDHLPGPGDLHIAPNPVRESTKISFATLQGETVSLKIYSLDNREVTVLLSNEQLPPGSHTYTWSPGDLPAGVYILRLITPREVSSAKIIVLKR